MDRGTDVGVVLVPGVVPVPEPVDPDAPEPELPEPAEPLPPVVGGTMGLRGADGAPGVTGVGGVGTLGGLMMGLLPPDPLPLPDPLPGCVGRDGALGGSGRSGRSGRALVPGDDSGFAVWACPGAAEAAVTAVSDIAIAMAGTSSRGRGERELTPRI